MKQPNYLISIIMPIYKMEEFLTEAIDSVVSQTIGFSENIQLILVNDGSPDGSADICKGYKEKYPDNIVYVEKENGGVSSARNAGIPYAEGRYINFMDADDIWSPDAFELIIKFFEDNAGIRIVTAKPVYFGRNDGKKSPLDYVYKKSCIINIEERPDMPLFGMNRSFFAADIIDGHRFDTEVAFSEDQLFLTEMVLEQKEFGIVTEASYNYRKREDNSSALDKAKTTPSYYTVTPERVFKAIIEKSVKEYGEVIPYVQNLMLTDLKFRIKPVPEGVLSEEELSDYRKAMKEILGVIDDDLIMGQKKLLFWHRTYFLKAKHTEEGFGGSVRSLLYDKFRLQADEMRAGDTIMISGIAHEKWVSDSVYLYAEDENGEQYVFNYEECAENDREGLFEDLMLKGYKHTVRLPLRAGAVYDFYLWDEDLEEREVQLRFGKGVRFDDEKKMKIDAGVYYVTASNDDISVNEKKNKYAAALADEAGISYEDAYNEMKQLKWATGLSFGDYLKKGLHSMDSHVRFRTAEKIVAKKERDRNYIEEISGITGSGIPEVKAEIRRVRALNRDKVFVTVAMYHDYELYNMEDEEAAEALQLLAERRSLCAGFREILEETFRYHGRIAELEKLYGKIKDINDKLLTDVFIDRYYKEFAVRYPVMNDDPEKRREIALDFLTLQNAAGYNITDYKIYDLFPKKLEEKLSFASNHEMTRAVRAFNSPEARALLDDKFGCYQKFGDYFGRELISVSSISDAADLERFCKHNRQFVKKPVYSRQGHGIRKVDIKDYKKDFDTAVKELLKEDGEFIAEEILKGHPSTAAFNEDSLNTVRIVTINTGEKIRTINIWSEAVRKGLICYAGRGIYCCTPFFKSGRKGSFVDNAGSGGCFAAIDLKKGTCSAVATGEDGSEYTVHPDSGLSFDSLRFDTIKELISTAADLALMIPEAGIVGWDFALTDEGSWILIEANYSPTFIGQAPAKCGVGREINQMILTSGIKKEEDPEEEIQD